VKQPRARRPGLSARRGRKGLLIPGEGDKYRVEGEGKLFGQAVKFTGVSDGADTFYKDGNDPKRDMKEKTPKAVGAYLRGALPHEGFFLSTLNMNRPGVLAADAIQPSDFKAIFSGPAVTGVKGNRMAPSRPRSERGCPVADESATGQRILTFRGGCNSSRRPRRTQAAARRSRGPTSKYP